MIKLNRVSPGHYTYRHLTIVKPQGTVNSQYPHWLIKDGHSIVSRQPSLSGCRQKLASMQINGRK
jgi:hypothetical protein